jgi:hypothetical protein
LSGYGLVVVVVNGDDRLFLLTQDKVQRGVCRALLQDPRKPPKRYVSAQSRIVRTQKKFRCAILSKLDLSQIAEIVRIPH